MQTPTVIVGENVAGQEAKAKKVLNQIKEIISGVNSSTFDLAELLHEVKTKMYYAKSFESFGKYAKSLDLKVTKSYYLVRIVDIMNKVGVPRESYEPVGIAKLRTITRLEPEGEYKGKPMTEVIKTLVDNALDIEPEELSEAVDTIKGVTGEDAIVWLNLAVKKSARDQIIKPALEIAKKMIGSVGKDQDGMSKDASDGSALESICQDFMANPANNYDTDALNKEDNQI